MNLNTPQFKHATFAILYVWAIILSITLGGKYIYNNILPKYFSNQDELVLNELEEDTENTESTGIFDNKEIPVFAQKLNLEPAKVLAAQDNNSKEEKRIEVDLTNQKLYAFEGDKKVFDFTVSTGKWGKTPTGEFEIWVKLKSTKMSGGSKELGTYYYLPGVPHTMYFYNDEIAKSRGFGIHGAYWHNNFGNPMSHGCINLSLEDAEKIYYWANPELGDKSSMYASEDNRGTKILIYGKAPNY